MNQIFIWAIILVIIAIVEGILSGTWNTKYFSYGILVYSKEIDLSDIDKTTTEIIYFINNLDTVKGFSKYKGRMIDENTFAFRKKMFTVSLFQNKYENIHGRIFIDPETRTLKIQGYMYYSFLAAYIYLFIFLMYDSDSIIASLVTYIIMISIISLLAYAFNHRKYNQLFKEIEKLIQN